MTRLYLSGPMAGYPGHNREVFNGSAKQLRDAGFEVVNPGEIDHGPAAAWEDCLRSDLRLLLDCEGVATLPEWQGSRGATLEVHVAKELRLPVLPVYAWLQNAPSCTCDGPYDAHPGFGHHPNCDLSAGGQP